MNKETMEIIKSTVPALRANGVEIAKHFYKTMFTNNPEVKSFFNMEKQESGAQPKALAMTVLAAAENIENLGVLMPAVKRIAEIHVNLDIRPEHYPIVGSNLLIAIKDILGDAATDEIMAAWTEAYGVIAEVFISVEREMYKERGITI